MLQSGWLSQVSVLPACQHGSSSYSGTTPSAFPARRSKPARLP